MFGVYIACTDPLFFAADILPVVYMCTWRMYRSRDISIYGALYITVAIESIRIFQRLCNTNVKQIKKTQKICFENEYIAFYQTTVGLLRARQNANKY